MRTTRAPHLVVPVKYGAHREGRGAGRARRESGPPRNACVAWVGRRRNRSAISRSNAAMPDAAAFECHCIHDRDHLVCSYCFVVARRCNPSPPMPSVLLVGCDRSLAIHPITFPGWAGCWCSIRPFEYRSFPHRYVTLIETVRHCFHGCARPAGASAFSRHTQLRV
jgi:hypothetical protein